MIFADPYFFSRKIILRPKSFYYETEGLCVVFAGPNLRSITENWDRAIFYGSELKFKGRILRTCGVFMGQKLSFTEEI